MMRKTVLVLIAAALAVALAGCSTQEDNTAVDAAASIVLDVRTPEEFAAGHLVGAVNIDFTADDFEQRIAELDPNGSYLIYCRSGNRSAQALTRMQALGFTDLTDLGSKESASSATGLDIVQ
jgi:rhodanese-related sulfurtransferase